MRQGRLTRRGLMASMAGLLAGGCVHPATGRMPGAASARRRIEDLVRSGLVPAAGLALSIGGKVEFACAMGLAQGAGGEAPPVDFQPDTPMRVASVSKMATALATHRLAATGLVDPTADIRGLFTPPLGFPAWPDSPITLIHLLSHTSGLRDPDVYWMASPGKTEALFTAEMWRAPDWGPPGEGFTYSNLGYGLAGAVLEKLTGIRFDQIAAQTVLAPLGLDAGFNWSGVSVARRRRGASLYSREDGASWAVQADGQAVLSGQRPAILLQEGFREEDYVAGSNGTLFSPQGGLRASLLDMLALVRASALDERMAQPVWRHDPLHPNGDDDAGYFRSYTAGCQVHPPFTSPIPGVGLIGHHGEAYGLFSAAFHVPDADAQIAFAVTGTSSRGAARSIRHPVMVEATQPLWAASADLLASV